MRKTTLFALVIALLFIVQVAPAVTGQEDDIVVVDAYYRVPIYVDLESVVGLEEGGSVVLTLMIDLETATLIKGAEPLSTTVQSVVVEVASDNDPALRSGVFVEAGPVVTSTVSSRSALAPTVASDATDSPPPTACKNANLRSGPGTKYGVVGAAKAGMALDLVGQDYDDQGHTWFQLVDESWISGSLVCDAPEFAPAAEPVVPTDTSSQADDAQAQDLPCNPGMEFTFVPAYGTENNLQGSVSCADHKEFSVAVFIYVEGSGWWTKPTFAKPITPIQRDGTWSTSIVTGGNDRNATKIVAFLVPSSYDPPIVSEKESLPLELYDNASIFVEAERTQSSATNAPELTTGPDDASVFVQVTGTEVRGTVSPPSVCNSSYKIALYAKTNHWWVQPFADERRNIHITDDCSWEATTNDWRQIAAHLVTADYVIEPEVYSESACPPFPLDPARDPGVLAATCYP